MSTYDVVQGIEALIEACSAFDKQAPYYGTSPQSLALLWARNDLLVLLDAWKAA